MCKPRFISCRVALGRRVHGRMQLNVGCQSKYYGAPSIAIEILLAPANECIEQCFD